MELPQFFVGLLRIINVTSNANMTAARRLITFFLFCGLTLPLFAQTPTWVVYDTDNSPIPSNLVHVVEKDHNGTFWVGTRSGLAEFDGINNWTIYDTSNSGLPHNWIWSIAFDSLDNKWLGLWEGQLVYYDGNCTVYDTNNSPLPIYNDGIYDLKIDQDGVKWVATGGSGLFSFDGITWNNYNTSNSPLSSNTLNSLEVDSANNIWVGTISGHGVHVFYGNSWANYYAVAGETINDIQEIFIDKDQNKFISSWQGGDGGELFIYKDMNWTQYSPENSGFPRDILFGIDQDIYGNYWFATDTGLVWFNTTTTISIIYNTTNSDIPNDRVLYVLCDSNDVWVATWGGLAVLKNGIYTGIEENFTSNNFKLYPNPFSDYAVLEFDNKKNESYNLTVYNTLGQVMLTTYGITSGQVKINKNNLTNGLYLFQLGTDRQITATGKFVVE